MFLFSKYDASGKLINEINGNKYLNQFNYDALERVLRITLQ
ncbi:MAG: RHS repeat protein [Ignavibacteria bacterium]|nr:RHS repeat protein [Ignavibacteria bacterium]